MAENKIVDLDRLKDYAQLEKVREDKIKNMTSSPFDAAATYDINDYARYNDELYMCKENGVTGAFDSTKWTKVVVSGVLEDIRDELGYILEDQLLWSRDNKNFSLSGTTASYTDYNGFAGVDLIPGHTYKLTVGDKTVNATVTYDDKKYRIGSQAAGIEVIIHNTIIVRVYNVSAALTGVSIRIVGPKKVLGTNVTLNDGFIRGGSEGTLMPYGTENSLNYPFALAVGNKNSLNATKSATIGYNNTITQPNSLIVGENSRVDGFRAVATGNNSAANGNDSLAAGNGAVAKCQAQFAHGRFNVSDVIPGTNTAANTWAEVVGNGSDENHRKNIYSLDWTGDIHAAGDVYVKAGDDPRSRATEGDCLLRAKAIVEPFDGTKPYIKGDYCTFGSLLCRYTSEIPPSSETTFDPTQWQEVDTTDLFLTRNNPTGTGNLKMTGDMYVGINDDSTGGQKLIRPSEMGLPVYSPTKKYQQHEACYVPFVAGQTYGDKWYKWGDATMTSAAGDFDPSKNWIEIKFGEGYLTRHNPTGTGALSLNRKGTVGKNSVAIGTEGQATGENSFAGGSKSKAVGSNSFAFGSSCTANGNLSFAFGNQAVAGLSGTTNTKMISIGASAKSEGGSSIAIGAGAWAGLTDEGTSAGHSDCIAIGLNSKAKGMHAVAIGTGANSRSNETVAIGPAALAEQNHAIAIGRYASAHNHKSMALGWYTSAVSPSQLTRGRANIEDTAANYADILGWGDVTESTESGVPDTVVRKNIEATTTTGDKKLKGDIYTYCNDDSTGGARLTAQLADDWKATTTYGLLDFCMYKGQLYHPKEAGVTGDWDETKWEKMTIIGAIKYLIANS